MWSIAPERLVLMSYTKGDSCKGTVTGTSFKGAFVRIDGTSDVGFCRCSLLPGDTAWFDVEGFTITADGTSFKLVFDSIISYGDNVVYCDCGNTGYEAIA